MLPAFACALAVAVLVAGEARDIPVMRAVAKPIASAAFVIQAVVAGAASTWPGRAVLVALLFSALGDVLLLSRHKRAFLAGLGAFLVAHLAFAAGFLWLGVWGPGFLAVVPLVALDVVIWRWLGPHTGRLRGPVVAYILAITAMVACASAAFADSPTLPRTVLLASAVAFLASDLCVARERFVTPGLANRAVGLPLYYAAQLGFALSIAVS